MALVAVALGQTAPSITNITNAAIPALDFPANSVALAPGSMAIIFGTNLADFVSSAPPPWQKGLGGVEVHLAEDSCYDSGCELVADLIYASPTQINFVVPAVPLYPSPNAHVWNTRVVLVKNGVRFDDRTRMLGGPGRVYIDAVYGYADYAVFGVGYDCLYSFSLSDPGACGLSWSEGQHRAILGAVTDAISGRLITTQNPVHQGQLLTFWMTGLTGDPWFKDNATFCYGVAQTGKDLPSGEGWCQSPNSPTMPGMWAGKSPEYPGLDQANVTFPACTNSTKAAAEKRYDVFLTFSGNTNVSQFSTGTTVRVYLPFVVNQGESDCNWSLKTTSTTLQSSPNPSTVGQAVTFTATVSPSAATGTVTFSDGSTALGSGTVRGGTATVTTSNLPAGNRSITASYNGDSNYRGSVATSAQSVKASTTIMVTSNTNPMVFGQSVVLTATVSPSGATGTVTFSDGTDLFAGLLGIGTLVGGKAICGIYTGGVAESCASGLGAGSHSIKVTYKGDDNFGSSSTVMTQVVNKLDTTTVLTSNINPSVVGQVVLLTATVKPNVDSATLPEGIVTFSDNGVVFGSASLPTPNLAGLAGRTSISATKFSAGTHSITAAYSASIGSTNGSSSTLTQIVSTAP